MALDKNNCLCYYSHHNLKRGGNHMYNDRKDSFSIKDIVLQILFVVLFVFILMYLFPSKQFVKDALTPLYDRIFNENILMMKDSAKSYYTTPRLPQKVGDKVSMTLGEMLDKKIILPFTDSKGRACSNTESYVEITKMDEEYIMKVNLKCTEQENYLLVYMGCYDYCKTTICEKNESDVKTPAIIPSKKTPTPDVPKPTPTPTPETPKPTPTPDQKEYICKYVKTVNASYTAWGNWSGWSTTSRYENDLTDVQTKTEVTYKEERVQIGERITTKTITYKDKNKPIYGNKQIQVGTEREKVCTATKTEQVGTGVYKYTEWKDTGVTSQFGSKPVNTELELWYWIATLPEKCGECAFGQYQIWGQQTRSKYEVVDTKQVCSNWEIKEKPIYTTVKVIVDYGTSQRVEKTSEPIYGTVKKPINTKYYRYRTRSIKDGWRDEKWSKCNDKDLLNDGYKWTGETKEK